MKEIWSAKVFAAQCQEVNRADTDRRSSALTSTTRRCCGGRGKQISSALEKCDVKRRRSARDRCRCCTTRTRACSCASMRSGQSAPAIPTSVDFHVSKRSIRCDHDYHVPLSRETAEELEQRGVNFHRALLLRPVPAPGEHLHLPQARHEVVQVGDELVHAWG